MSLVFVVIAATLGAAAPVIGMASDIGGRASGLVAGIALGLLPLPRFRLGIAIYQTWSRLRSVSEALKAEVYTFVAGVDPYRDADRLHVLRRRSRDVLMKGDDLLKYVDRVESGPRQLPRVTDVASYLSLRVGQQIDGYYRPQAASMGRKAQRVRVLQVCFAVAAVVLGVFSSIGYTEIAPWIGVIGTVTGAVTAHSAAGRYGYLQLEYLRTAEQLDRLVAEYHDAAPTPQRDDDVVAECERVISYQNEAWMAELVTVPPQEPGVDVPPPV